MTDLELNDLPVVEFFGNDYMYSNGVFPLSPTFTMFAVAGFDWVNSASDASFPMIVFWWWLYAMGCRESKSIRIPCLASFE